MRRDNGSRLVSVLLLSTIIVFFLSSERSVLAQVPSTVTSIVLTTVTSSTSLTTLFTTTSTALGAFTSTVYRTVTSTVTSALVTTSSISTSSSTGTNHGRRVLPLVYPFFSFGLLAYLFLRLRLRKLEPSRLRV